MKGKMVLFLKIYIIFIFMYHSIVVSSSFYFLTLLKTKVTELKLQIVLRLFFPLKLKFYIRLNVSCQNIN